MHVILLLTPITCYLDTPVIYSCYLLHSYSCYLLQLSTRYMFTHTHTHTTEVPNTWKVFPVFLSLVPIIRGVLWIYRTMYVTVLLNIYQLGMGRLYNWLDLVGWVFWIHLGPTAGDMVVMDSVRYSSLSFLFLVPLLAEGPGLSMPGDRLGPWSRVCTGYTHLIRAPRSLGLMALVLHSRLVLCRLLSYAYPVYSKYMFI